MSTSSNKSQKKGEDGTGRKETGDGGRQVVWSQSAPPEPAQCHKCHACHTKWRSMSPSATPTTQNARRCVQMPRLPHKQPRLEQNCSCDNNAASTRFWLRICLHLKILILDLSAPWRSWDSDCGPAGTVKISSAPVALSSVSRRFPRCLSSWWVIAPRPTIDRKDSEAFSLMIWYLEVDCKDSILKGWL